MTGELTASIGLNDDVITETELFERSHRLANDFTSNVLTQIAD
jgi:hypothetical protein